MLQADPTLAGWLSQNLVYSPPLRNFIWGYGLLLPLWLVGCIALVVRKRSDPWWMLFVFWSTGIWLLLYLPLTVNRRFVNGWHIALALVAAYGFLVLYREIRRGWLKVLYAGTMFLFLISSIGFFLFTSLFFSPDTYSFGYYYVSPAEDAAIAFLGAESEPSDTFLTSDTKTAFILTSELNRAVFRGHDHQTPQAHLRLQQQEWFFSENTGPAALTRKASFARDNGISYVMLNRNRLDVPVSWVREADFLESAYQSDAITIYRVIP